MTVTWTQFEFRLELDAAGNGPRPVAEIGEINGSEKVSQEETTHTNLDGSTAEGE